MKAPLLSAALLAALTACCTEAPAPEAPNSPADAAPAEAAPPTNAASAAAGWSVGDTIPSGLNGVPDVEILEVRGNGSGAACGTGKTATLAYKAMKANGEVLDPGSRPFTFQVGSGQAIVGWDKVVSRMRVGDSFVILMPEALAYPGRGDLKFEMELLSVR